MLGSKIGELGADNLGTVSLKPNVLTQDLNATEGEVGHERA